MRRRHFEALRPVCPVCRDASGTGSALHLAHTVREENDHIIEGALHCSNPQCFREYPIIDGIPLLVTNIRQYISENLLAVYGRSDLSSFIESILGDCCGPNSIFDQTRQYLSSYTWDHFGDLDTQETAAQPQPASMLRILTVARDLVGTVPVGPVLDIGCAIGRSAFELAQQTSELVLGVDLHFAMLRVASEALRTGIVRYPRRRSGLVYERREIQTRFNQLTNVDFWACDATALPFPGGAFSCAFALNVLDCVQAPRELLLSLQRALRPGGKAALTSPYDWSPGATPLEAWLGGHSQRAPQGGSSEAVLRSLLTPDSQPGAANGLRLVLERDDLPWHVRLHDRSTVSYKVHLAVCERQ